MVNLITEHIDIWAAAQIQKANGGRGRGKNSNGQSPHGIKKLRELILELAVRGKIVPQDSNDEPASVLLEKIANEKVRLIEEGKIKEQKPLPEISEDEKPFELSEGWEWARFSDCYDVRDGTHDSPKYQTSGFPLVTSKNLSSGKLELVNVKYISRKDHLKIIERSKVDRGDILFAMIGSIGNPVIVDTGEEFSIKNVALFKYYSAELSSPIYLKLFLELAAVVMREKATGGVQSFVSLGKLRAHVIALPPLAEQHRIVTKVDELMALCDQLEQQQTGSNATHQTLVETLLATLTNATDQSELEADWQRIANHFDTLLTTEQSIDQLKQTILQLAVMGKLVPQDPIDLPAPARASHADGPQSGKFFVYALECENKSIYIGQTNDILNRWKEHATGKGADWTKKHPPLRLVHWEEYNSREEAIRREKELKTGFGRKWLKRELAAGRTRQAGEPASFLLEKIAKEKARLIKEGKIKKQKPLPEISTNEKPFELPQGWKWVRLGATGLGSTGKTPSTKNPKYYDGAIPFLGPGQITLEGDITDSDKTLTEEGCKYSVIAESGDILMVCIGGSIGKSAIARSKIAFNQQINCIRPLYGDSKYLNDAINTPHFQTSILDAAAGSATPIINRSKWEELLVALPPLSEQHRIVAKVDELMALCDALKARLNNAQTTQVQLADAIVEQAVA